MAKAQPTHEVIILGTGFSGLGAAIQLKQQGRERFVVLEKAQAIGGTWRDNDYPGCACDVAAPLYSFSFAPNPSWSQMYPLQAEIKTYLEQCANRFGVREKIVFGAEAVRADWDETNQFWSVTTRDGQIFSGRVLVSGMGGLHIPAYPALPGLDRFAGKTFHSARWDHSYDLADKRVAVIGTGASAIQFVPKIAPKVAALHLMQRTPPWILPKFDRRMAGWEQSTFAKVPMLQDWLRRLIYARNEVQALAFLRPAGPNSPAEQMARAHLQAQVKDDALRAKLTPTFALGCKRVLISNDYYPALQRPNVTVETTGISAVTETGLQLSDGRLVEADCLIYATGFKPMDVVTGCAFYGRGGRRLADDWREGPEAYLGITVTGFPNLFFLMGPNTGLGHNSMIFMIESQIAYVLDALDALDVRKATALEVMPSAQLDFIADTERRLGKTVWASGCRSWYLSEDGKNHTLWPDFTFSYRSKTRRVKLHDYTLSGVEGG